MVETTVKQGTSTFEQLDTEKLDSQKEIKTATTCRPLGYLELWYQRNDFILVGVAQLSCSDLNKDHLKMACDAMSKKHPVLRLNIDLEHKNRRICFKELVHHPFIDPKIIDGKNVQQVVEEEMNERFHVGNNYPLWRVTGAKQGEKCWLIVSLHKCICDNPGMRLLVSDLLDFYLSASKKTLDISNINSLPMVPDAEELCFLNDTMDEQRVSDSAGKVSEELLGRNHARILDSRHYKYHQKYIDYTGSQSDFRSLLDTLEKQDVSLRAFFSTVILRALDKQFREKKESLQLLLAVDLRNLVKPKLGNNHIALLDGYIELNSKSGSDLWARCKQTERQIQQALKNNDPMYWVPIHRVVNEYSSKHHDHAMKNSGRLGDATLEISCLDINHEILDSMHTMFSNKPFGWTFNFNLNIIKHQICLSLTYDSALIEDTTAKKLMDEISRSISQCTSQ